MNLKDLAKQRWLLVLAAFGVLLMLIGTFLPSNNKPATAQSGISDGTTDVGTTTATDDTSSSQVQVLQSRYETELTNILSTIQGVHSVSVMVTLNTSELLKVATNSQTSSTQPGSSTGTSTSDSTQIYSGGGLSGGGPMVVERVEPDVRGVLVTVNADDFVLAKSEIIDGIQNVLDVPAYKISVEPQKGNS